MRYLRVWTCGEAGDYSGGDTPVPIPNTVVKPSSPNDTAGAALWDNRTLPVSPPAQPPTAPHEVYAYDIPRLPYAACTCGEAGDYSVGAKPVPIPNTVVKPSSPNDTAG